MISLLEFSDAKLSVSSSSLSSLDQVLNCSISSGFFFVVVAVVAVVVVVAGFHFIGIFLFCFGLFRGWQ